MTSSSGNPGLYIHIPFCRTRCGYCSFYSQTDFSRNSDFVEALQVEMSLYRGRFGPFDTIYLGGGTPSALGPGPIATILRTAARGFDIVPGAEITVEANPADLEAGLLHVLKEEGVNRLNIGVQAFDEETLRFLGRRHTVAEAVRAVELSREEGFSNIGIDLIYGVPAQGLQRWGWTLGRAMDLGLERWRRTLDRAVGLGPEHLSCYQLSLEAGTPLGKKLGSGEFELPGEEEAVDFFMETSRRLEAAGYLHYEVSNFCRGDRFASVHNRKYWDHTPYLGLGPASHSFDGRRRWWNRASLETYIASLSGKRFPVEGEEELTVEMLGLEAFFLGLRTRKGIDLARFREDYGIDLLEVKGESIEKLRKEGLVIVDDGMLRPTLAGMAVADSLALI
jgi:oxygen-independent coproporphyrinogen III oxidase